MVEYTREMKALTWKEVFASMNPSPVFEALAMLAEDLAIKDDGGASILDLRVRYGKRLSVFRSYTFPYMDRR